MIYYTQKELQEIKDLETSFNDNNISFMVAQYLLGENALPDTIMELKKEIDNTSIDEAYRFEYYPDYPGEEEGFSILGSVLKVGKKEAHRLVADPRSAGKCLRALRDKYEDIYFKSQRARAEDRGFFSTILYTIKRAIYWIIKKFQDLKDSVVDIIKDRPEYSSRTKRDYLWLRDQEDNWLAHNTYWYNNSEY